MPNVVVGPTTEALPHVDEVKLKFPRGQAELCDAWLRQSAVRAAESAEGLGQSTGIDLRGSHRNEVPPEFVRAQLDAVFGDIGVDAAKTGMLFSARMIET